MYKLLSKISEWNQEEILCRGILKDLNSPAAVSIGSLLFAIDISTLPKNDLLDEKFIEEFEQIKLYKKQLGIVADRLTVGGSIKNEISILFEIQDSITRTYKRSEIFKPVKRIITTCLHYIAIAEIDRYFKIPRELTLYGMTKEGRQSEYPGMITNYKRNAELLCSRISDHSKKNLPHYIDFHWIDLLIALRSRIVSWEMLLAEAKDFPAEMAYYEEMQALRRESDHNEFLDSQIASYCPYCETQPCVCGKVIW